MAKELKIESPSWWEWCFENRVYFYPLLVPMFGYYVMDFIQDLMVILQVVSILVIIGGGAAFMGGVWFAMVDRKMGDNLIGRRFIRFLKPGAWGYLMTIWLMEDE